MGGIPFTYGPLAYLLKNRTYLGETGHNGAGFTGEHEAIIDRDTFDKVQQLIKSHSVTRSGRQHASGALLKTAHPRGGLRQYLAADKHQFTAKIIREQMCATLS